MTIPAKAGIHCDAARAAETWAPAGVYPRAARRADPWAGTNERLSLSGAVYKVLDCRGDVFRLLDLGVVAGGGNRDKGGALQPLGQVRAVGRLDDAVPLAPDHEARHGHAVQPVAQAGVV